MVLVSMVPRARQQAKATTAGPALRPVCEQVPDAVRLSGVLDGLLLPVSPNEVVGQSMRTIVGIIGLCVASWLCFEVYPYLSVLGESAAYLVWLGLLTLAGFLSGFLWPRSLVWGALFVTWSQSALPYEHLASSGELQHPTRSTGGEAGWMIATMLLVFFSPVPALASWYGTRLRAMSAHPDPAADDASRGG